MPFRTIKYWAFLAGFIVVLPNPSLQAQAPGAMASTIATKHEPNPAIAARESTSLDSSSADSAVRRTQKQERDETKDRQKTPPAPTPDATGCIISGTVTTVNGDIVPGAMIRLRNADSKESWSTVASETGAFQFEDLQPGSLYSITIEAEGFEVWKSGGIRLAAGQYFFLTKIEMRVPELVTSITVYGSREQIATEQVMIQEKQRVFGFIPNFYVSYDPTPVPLTTKLKFKLALKADTDAMTFVGVAFIAGTYQAGDMLDYGQGMGGFAKRVGAGYADTTTDIFMGGAILPWLFRQDPRYFYQGTGTRKARALHAVTSPYLCKGDSGKMQPNYSSLGGDLASGAISNLYYPESNRGAKLMFQGFLMTTGVRTVNAVFQEFLFRKLTPSARSRYLGQDRTAPDTRRR